MDNFYKALRQTIINDETEGEEILKSLVSPSDIKARQNGALFNIIVRGLSIFNCSSVVREAGIADDDPRAKKFNTVHGFLIDKQYVNRLQNISAKKDRIAVAAGGVPVMNHNKYLYWIPNKGISQFKAEMEKLAEDYRGVVREIYDNYAAIYCEARKITEESAGKVWEQLSENPAFAYSLDKELYVNEALVKFDRDFVKQNELFSKINIDVLLSDNPYHPVLEQILESADVQPKSDGEIIDNFFDMLEARTDSAETIQELKKSFRTDAGLSMTSKIDLEIMKNVSKISECLDLVNESSQKVSRRKLKNLYDRIAMHRGNRESLDKVIRMTNSMLTGSIDTEGVDELNRLVLVTLKEVETEIDLEGAAGAIANQAKNGEAREALDRLQELEAGLESRLMMAQAMKHKVMTYFNADMAE